MTTRTICERIEGIEAVVNDLKTVRSLFRFPLEIEVEFSIDLRIRWRRPLHLAWCGLFLLTVLVHGPLYHIFGIEVITEQSIDTGTLTREYVEWHTTERIFVVAYGVSSTGGSGIKAVGPVNVWTGTLCFSSLATNLLFEGVTLSWPVVMRSNRGTRRALFPMTGLVGYLEVEMLSA